MILKQKREDPGLIRETWETEHFKVLRSRVGKDPPFYLICHKGNPDRIVMSGQEGRWLKEEDNEELDEIIRFFKQRE